MENVVYRSLAPLFGQVSSPGPRKLLIELLMTIAECSIEERKARLFASAHLISKLNAFDAKWVEQPDFNQRLDGFKEVHEMLEKGQIDSDLGVIIIHNCFHFLRTVSIRNISWSETELELTWNIYPSAPKFLTKRANKLLVSEILVVRCTSIIHFRLYIIFFQEKDLSLKDSAGYCLRKVAPAVCLLYRHMASEVEFLVSDSVLPLVRAGIRDRNETVQHESVKLLGEMVSIHIWSYLKHLNYKYYFCICFFTLCELTSAMNMQGFNIVD